MTINTINTNTEFSKKKLYPYQEDGVEFLIENNGGILLDEQGCGKTIQTITALERLFADNTISKALIVCPSIMRRTWLNELRAWFRLPTSFSPTSVLPEIQVLERTSDTVSKTACICIASYDYVTANYRKCPSSSAGNIRYNNFNCIVCDESHKIKNPKAIRTQAIHHIMSHPSVKVRILLTGTPITKGVDDLYSQLRPFVPAYDLGKNIFDFRKRFMFQRNNGFGVEYYGCKDSEKLHSLLYSVSLRRTKKEVLTQLPKLLHNKVFVDIKKTLADESLKFVDIALQTVLGKYVKLDVDTQLHIAQVRKTLGLAKVKATVQYIMSILDIAQSNRVKVDPNNKIVVFAYHSDVIDALENALSFANISCAVIKGDTSNKVRQERIEKFQNTNEIQVLIVNMIAGGVGITLTSSNTEIFAELDWTPANIQQAEARCHRIGQNRDVNVVFMLAENSLDTSIFDTLIEKMEVTNKVL